MHLLPIDLGYVFEDVTDFNYHDCADVVPEILQWGSLMKKSSSLRFWANISATARLEQ